MHFQQKKVMYWGDRGLCALTEDEWGGTGWCPAASAFVSARGPSESLWMKEEGILEARLCAESLLWWSCLPLGVDEWLLQAHRCAENYKSWRKQKDVGTCLDRDISWGQMLILASKENYKCGIQECRLRQRKNELQEGINTKASRNKCGEIDTEKRRKRGGNICTYQRKAERIKRKWK